MSLKKRMFRSNMAILFLALLSLLVIMMVVLVTFEDSIEENIVRRWKFSAWRIRPILKESEI